MKNTREQIIVRLDILCAMGCPKEVIDKIQELTDTLDLLSDASAMSLSLDILRLTYRLEIDLNLDSYEKRTNTQ